MHEPRWYRAVMPCTLVSYVKPYRECTGRRERAVEYEGKRSRLGGSGDNDGVVSIVRGKARGRRRGADGRSARSVCRTGILADGHSRDILPAWPRAATRSRPAEGQRSGSQR